MPVSHERTYRVRHYECNAFGHLRPANFLRYMQEAAFDASAAVGYDLDRYQALGRHWLIRQTDIEYLRPLRYGDSVRVRTWVADFRRVRSRRAYEFLSDDPAEPVARALTDWVFLDSSTNRPASIPPDMMAAFCPEGIPAQTPWHLPIRPTSPVPVGVFRQRLAVEWQDLDPARHMNNAVYLDYVEDCGVRALTAQEWPAVRLKTEGLVLVPRQHQMQYRLPALLHDELELTTWLSGATQDALIRNWTISRLPDRSVLAEARAMYVAIDPDTGHSASIPAHILTDLMASDSHPSA